MSGLTAGLGVAGDQQETGQEYFTAGTFTLRVHLSNNITLIMTNTLGLELNTR